MKAWPFFVLPGLCSVCCPAVSARPAPFPAAGHQQVPGAAPRPAINGRASLARSLAELEFRCRYQAALAFTECHSDLTSVLTILTWLAGKLEGASKLEGEAKEKARRAAQEAEEIQRQRQQLVSSLRAVMSLGGVFFGTGLRKRL